jgi:hypothetical protein
MLAERRARRDDEAEVIRVALDRASVVEVADVTKMGSLRFR